MKLYEAPEFTKIELYTEDVLALGDSIIDAGGGGVTDFGPAIDVFPDNN